MVFMMDVIFELLKTVLESAFQILLCYIMKPIKVFSFSQDLKVTFYHTLDLL